VGNVNIGLAKEIAMAAGVLYPTVQDAGNWGEAVSETRGMFMGTPEIYFAKRIDNSRIVRIVDPKRRREMLTFGVTLSILFLMIMVYLLQHLSAIEYGYRIEQAKADQNAIVESNRELKLEESSLTDLQRIEIEARKLGMVPPSAGQIYAIESGSGDSTVPVMAKASPSGITVISYQQ
jgi:cell division protein FtsL